MSRMGNASVATEPSGAKSDSALGFLTIVEHPQDGLFGGYLVLNRAGRPLEFHCTAPIKPNRAQEILYGPTLGSYLYGEQIGQTLLANAKAQPEVVCTDREPALAVRDYVSVPVVLVLSPDDPDGPGAETQSDLQRPLDPGREDARERTERTWRLDAAHGGRRALTAFRLGRNRLAVPEPGLDERRLVTERLSEISDWLDLAEPFQRIREAIEEARRGVQ